MFIVGLIVIFVAALVALAGEIWLIGLTFQRSLTWGILVVMALISRLILSFPGCTIQVDPQVSLLLGITITGSLVGIIVIDWQKAKTAFFWWLFGGGTAFGVAFLMFAQLSDSKTPLDHRKIASHPKTRQQFEAIRKVVSDVQLQFGGWITPPPSTPPPRRVQALAPVFVSTLPPLIEGGRQRSAAGTFYMVDRASLVTKTGVRAIRPGDIVQLRERLRDGKLRVSYGPDTFTVAEWQVTEDLATAREAEKRDFLEHSGRL